MRAKSKSAQSDYWIEEPSFRVHRRRSESSRIVTDVRSRYDASTSPIPVEVHAVRWEDGDEVAELRVEVHSMEFDKPIPEERFTIASMNVPVNTAVVDYRIQYRLGYWDGEKLSRKFIREK